LEVVIVNPDGHRYADSVIDRYRRMAKSIAAITRRFRVHDLRHSFGSTLASACATELMLKGFFGHGSTKMVQRCSRPSAAAMKVTAVAFDGTDAGLDGQMNGHPGDKSGRAVGS
jgi:integrase